MRVLARDVVPFEWALWCTGEGGGREPFANTIVAVRWEPSGRLSFMLDTHNFLSADPDDELELVPLELRGYYLETAKERRRQHREMLARGPEPATCPTCHQPIRKGGA